MKEKIKLSDIVNELREAYLDYALSVIISRALPDVRDGLKPVQRRILYVMKELSLWPNEKFTKCANVVGNTLARYHPHGDQPVYEALVRLAQDFSLRYPLIIGQGNFGSIDGDPPAQMRYTECKLSSFSVEMLSDIEKDTVDFRPNYDNTKKEPIVLPSKIPQIILNGTSGIAVGMATNIPSHNLAETCNAIIELIKNPNLGLNDILKIIKGPDFPTGGIIYGEKSLYEAYKNGRGGIVIRGKVNIEETKRGLKKIIITEIPWQTNKSELVKQIANLSIEKIITEIKEVRDESNKDGIRIVIEITEREDKNIQKIIDRLYKLTDLQKNYYFNFIALDEEIQPKIFNLKGLLTRWIDHRREVIKRRTKHDLEKTKERIEILEGFKIALQDIDSIIKIIKKSIDKESAKKSLIQKLKINERQADSILEMPLRSLTSLETKKIIDELREKLKLKIELENILKYSKKIDEIIIKETEKILKKYSDKRKTEIKKEDINLEKIKEEIPEEDVLLFINEKKFVRVYKIDTPIEKILKDKENFGEIILTKTNKSLLAYSKKGKIYQILVKEFYQTPKYLEANIILDKNDEILNILRPLDEKYILIFTKNGLGKKMKIEDVLSVKRRGIQIIKLKNNDVIRKIILFNSSNILLITKNGFGLGMKDEIPLQTKSASGVKIIKLKNDELFNASLINKNYLILIFSCGYFKKIFVNEINIQKRGGKGIKLFNLKNKFGNLIFADLLNDDDQIAVINEKLEIIKVKDIPTIKRVHQPIKICNNIYKVSIL